MSITSLRAGVATVTATLAFLAAPLLASADSVGPITFDSQMYTLGSINGQNGWAGTNGSAINPSIDQEIVSSASSTAGYNYNATFGNQSLRISDAFTDGAFGDWIFSPSLTNDAGETAAVSGGFSGGTRQKHFEAQFDLASALPNQIQTGMHMSVSPDRGDGARMSYLRFEDHTDGIHVFFDDVTDAGPKPTTATFNESDIATLDRTKTHTIKFSIDFNDGPGNDVVKIYIDGALRHIGTTWEDYYRFDPEQAGGGNVVPTVDSLIFQTRTGSGPVLNPADSGHGFLVDNLSLESGPTPMITTNVVQVTQNDLETNLANAISSGKWYFYNDTNDTLNNALGSFVTGPSTPPLGTGSAEATLADATGRVLLTNSAYGGTLLSAINKLGFSEYSHSGSGVSATEVPFVRFNVDFTGSNVFQHSLVYEPNDNGTVTQNTWQTWDMINSGNAKWEFTNQIWPTTATGPDAGVVGQSGNIPRTWNQIIADYPNIQMLASGPQIGVRVGEPGPAGYTADVDAFTIGTGSTATTFDFDPAQAPTTVKVQIDKFIDGHAASTTASTATFPMASSWNATNIGQGSGTFSLSAANSYEAVTADMSAGASYSTNEIADNQTVGTCAAGAPFELIGYSTGATYAAALAGISSPSVTAPSFTNMSSDEYVIVLNKTCPPAATYKVHILKYLDNATSTAASAGSYQFLMVSTWNATNIGASSGSYTLGTNFGGASDLYGADTSPMTGPYDYVTSEVMDDASSRVISTKDACTPGKFLFLGYKSSPTSFADAAIQATSSTPIQFSGVKSDEYVLVYNATCPTMGSLTVTKSSIGGNNTFNFTSDIPGHASFQITTVSNTGSVTFDNLAPGTYHVTEVNQPSGWTQTETSCDVVPLSAGQEQNCVVTDTNNKLLGSIRGTKFEDWDGDGSPFETRWEDPVAGVAIFIDKNNNGHLDSGEVSMLTNKQGLYDFTGLTAGTYRICEAVPTGWMQTYPSTGCWSVTIAAGQNAKKKDFGNFKLGTISGMKYEDKDGNHHKDNGESGLQGWTIVLKKTGGGTMSTTTDASGNYSFTNLGPGHYTLSEVIQNDWRQTDHPNPVRVHSGMNATHEDFGNKRIIGNAFSHDHDQDSDDDN